jgi:hypothetical protein
MQTGSSAAVDDDSDITKACPPSDRIVSTTLQKGLEKMLVQTSVGMVVGGLAGLVLVRAGRASGARKGLAGLGAGLGLGSAWTRTSMDLEEMLLDNNSKNE